jgi:PAS domain S-box-containing protein
MPSAPQQPSLSRRISLSLGILSTVIVLAVTALVLLFLVRRVGEQMEERAESAIVFLAQSLETPFWALDQDSAVAVAQAMAMNPAVGLLELRDGRGETWFVHDRGGKLFIVREAAVLHEGQVIGRIRLGLDDSDRTRTLTGIGLAGGGLALLIIAAQYFLAARLLRRSFRAPFGALDALVGAYARGEYDVPDPQVGYAEFAPLTQAFLDMGRTIERQMSQLRESEERFRTIFDNSPVGIFRTTFEGALLEGNPALARMFGYAGQEEFLASEDANVQAVYADPTARRNFLQAVLQSDSPVSVETAFMRKDGSVFDAVLTASVQRDGGGRPLLLNGVVEDVSARKEAERSLARERQLMAAIFESVPGLLFLYDSRGRLVRWNKAHETLTGYCAEELAGRSLLDWFAGPGENVTRVADALRRGRKDGAATVEAELQAKDGRSIPMLFSGVGVTVEGEVFLTGIGIDITERKKVEAALAESERKYKSLFETMPNGFYRSTPQGSFIDANPSFVEMLGYDSLEELRQVSIPRDVFVHEAERDSILTDNTEFTDALERYRLRRKDGKIIWVEDNARYIRDDEGRILYHEGICRDVTERREVEERLRQSEEKFSRLFRLSPDVIVLMGLEDGGIIDVNEAFSRVTGHGWEESVGKTAWELGLYERPEDRVVLRQAIRERELVENVDFALHRRDGGVIPCVLSAQRILLEGRECVLCVLRDVTELKRMQEMMIQTEKMISVGGIAAGVAHEINNPLGIIMVNSQNLALRTKPDFPKNLEVARGIGLDMVLLDRYMRARGLHGFIDNIQQAALRAADIIRHMLDFSRRSESKRRVCDLRVIIERAIFLAESDYDLKKNYDFRKIEIAWETDDGPHQVNCTETEIEQVFLNLLRNSAQAMATARPEIVGPRIVIRLHRSDDRVVVEMEDNGPGMPPEVQRRAFEPFFTTKSPGVGTGLGLSVSYFIITRSHDGRMSLESAPGRGAKFTIDLPALPEGRDNACPEEQ